MNENEIVRMERVFKGVANHWRLRILDCIDKHNGISVDELSEILKCNYKTLSEHIRRLKIAGLIYKKYKGRRVEHTLTPYGIKIIKIARTFSHS